MTGVFPHGGLRLYLLLLLEDQPRHGYELIRQLEDRFMGMYTPSAGTVYPRLAALEAAGLLGHELVDGRKVYALTAEGVAELHERRDEASAVAAEAVRSAHALAAGLRDEVRSSVRDIRREVKDAVREVRREEHRVGRDARTGDRGPGRDARRSRDGDGTGEVAGEAGRDGGRRGERDLLRSLRADVDSFAVDVVAAARHSHLDAKRLRMVRTALLDARQAIIAALAGGPEAERPPAPEAAQATGEPGR